MRETLIHENKAFRLSNPIYYWIGLAFLILNKARRSIQGYTSPRTFSITEFTTAVEYDFRVVNNWMQMMKEYLGSTPSLEGRTILELGPGADLGIGIIMLMKGAKKYNAIDVNNLVESVPERFYAELFEYIDKNSKDELVLGLEYLRTQLRLTQNNKNDKLNYVCNKDFDMSVFNNETIDMVFSQAAFEHFADVDCTLSQLSSIVKAGTILIAEIDLKTHTRWIRDKDPLNIYRYSDTTYKLFKFSGSPNRLRPFEYIKILQKYGWIKINIIPLSVLGDDDVLKMNAHLSKQFRDSINQMGILSMFICATKE